ncbi:MAG: penicillin-binding protein 2 [Bacteroidales bacterium]|nr:penicillin-binding protein 2 [Bacteroidales bacterium]
MRKDSEIKDKIVGRDRIHVVMFFLSLAFMVLGVFILVWIVKIQTSYTVPEEVIDLFRPKTDSVIYKAVRGRILATDGRPLALSVPLYDLHMDCTVLKKKYKDENKDSLEQVWQDKARKLAVCLSEEFRDKSAEGWADIILNGRDNDKKYLLIKKNINLSVLERVKQFPLFEEGRNAGGIIIDEHPERIYPYDSLARRVIGYMKYAEDGKEDNRGIGLEYSFESDLHGTDGCEYRRVTDNGLSVRDPDLPHHDVKNGKDLRTTLNIDFQDIADKALRAQIRDHNEIRAAICIIMEVKTGAIRAMVNLSRGDTPQTTLYERENLALMQVGEPGSVMKGVTLLSLVEDGYVKNLEETIPTNNGVLSGYQQDNHILTYQSQTGKRVISVIHGFAISSNYVFASLAERYYGKKPQEFYDHIYSYRLGEAFDFDIEGLRSPVVNRPGTSGWSGTTLGSNAYGYGIGETPLHIITFYNGIANKGRLMKPYLVESIEKDGEVERKFVPKALNESICSAATADTVTRALRAVVTEGTANRLKSAKLPVAGKTGTAQVVLTPAERKGSSSNYIDAGGRHKNQGTFVGFFPVDKPKYTILVTVYSYLSKDEFAGGRYPALAVRDIVNQIYALDADWRQEIQCTGTVPEMTD